MPAYLIVTAKIHDRARFIEGYGKAAAELTARMGGRYIVRAPGLKVWEGEGPEGASVVVSEWPDMAALERFWHSPEYAEAKKLRDGIAEVNAMAVSQP
jgi:uncharacterized protein (DUF1330 family)